MSIRRSKFTIRNGFTIVELLIVVVVIAILAVVIIVGFNGLQRRASLSAALTAVNGAQKQIELYKISNSTYPATLAVVNINNSASTTYEYTVDGTGTTYCVTATANKASAYIGSNYQPAQAGGCAGHAVDGVATITNYVLNPGAEAGKVNGWTNQGSATSAIKYAGNQSIMYTAAATPTDTAIYVQTTVPVTGTYYASAYVYITGNGNSFTGGTSYGRDVMWMIGSASHSNYNRSLLNQWQRVQATAVVTGAPANLQIRFYPPAGATVYVDNVMITTANSAYADGNTSGWVWNGAANNSTSSGLPQ